MSTLLFQLGLGNLPSFGNGKKERAHVEDGLEDYGKKRDKDSRCHKIVFYSNQTKLCQTYRENKMWKEMGFQGRSLGYLCD